MRGHKTIDLWKDNGYREMMSESMTKLNIPLDELCFKHLSGESASELAGVYSCDVHSIISRLKKMGVYKSRRGFQKGHTSYSGMFGKKLSEKAKEKIRRSQLGEKNNNWKGGVSTEEQLIRESASYNDWRKSVYKRDNYTCQECGCVGKNLEAHHIKSFAKYSQLRLDISNGITLCKKCHLKTKTKESLFEQKYINKLRDKMKNKNTKVIYNG